MKKYAALIIVAVMAIPVLYVAALKKYIVFAGRASRAEYGVFIICNGIIAFFLYYFLFSGFFSAEAKETPDPTEIAQSTTSIIASVFSWATLLPTVTVTVRRLHDMGASGWWSLLLIPCYLLPLAIEPMVEAEGESFIGIIVITIVSNTIWLCIFLFLVFRGGNKYDNKYGAFPPAAPQAAY